MYVENHPENGKACWMTRDELELLFSKRRSTRQLLAFELMANCGLRSREATDVCPQDVQPTPQGVYFVSIRSGKGDKYRQTPMPLTTATRVETYADAAGLLDDDPVLDTTTRSIRRWVDRAGKECYAETGDPDWTYVSPHDLRRSWGQNMRENGVEPGLLMEYGGWDSWDYFREHYMGQYSIEKQAEVIAGIDWF